MNKEDVTTFFQWILFKKGTYFSKVASLSLEVLCVDKVI